MATLEDQEVEQLVIDFQRLNIKAASRKMQDMGKDKQSISRALPSPPGLVNLPAELLNRILLLVSFGLVFAVCPKDCCVG